MPQYAKITPNMFVSKPFKKCPQCGVNEYGVLMINSRSYVRRCNKCMYSESYDLPDLNKKVVYLDQMAISNMMNVINPKTKKNPEEKWKTLFEKLDRLCKLQLIICPSSSIHEEESVATECVYNELKQMYQHLSHGVSFYYPETIIRFQIYEAFMRWLNQDVDKINVHDITLGSLYEWQDRIRISVNFNRKIEDYVSEVKQDRKIKHEGLKQIFKRWKSEQDKTFETWFNEERDSCGPAYWRSYIQSVLSGNVASCILSEKSASILELKGILRKEGITQEENILRKLTEFFNSEEIKEVPYIKIHSMLCATIAEQAALFDRIQPPDRGTSNDLSLISSFSPYCDALFIDNGFKDLVTKADKRIGLGIKEKVFSQSNFQEFIDYLDRIEKSATADHLNLIKEVYGDDWEIPYLEMYGSTTTK